MALIIFIFIVITAVLVTVTAILVKECVALTRENRHLSQSFDHCRGDIDEALLCARWQIRLRVQAIQKYLDSKAPESPQDEPLDMECRPEAAEEKHCDTDAAI